MVFRGGEMWSLQSGRCGLLRRVARYMEAGGVVWGGAVCAGGQPQSVEAGRQLWFRWRGLLEVMYDCAVTGATIR